MKAEIYQWVRTLAAFYILFTAVLQLIPDKKYERYIRSFMGLLLIYILSVPLLSIVKNSGAVIEDFSRNYNEEVSVLEKKETQNLQGFYIRKGFEQELTSQITKKCEEKGIKIQEVIVDIEGEQISVSLTAGQSLDLQQEGRLKDELRQEFGIKEQNIRIFTGEAGKTAVDRASASGASSVGDRTSGIAEDRYSPTQSTVEIQSILELKLQDILESMEGAGKVKVMLMTGEQQGIYQSEEAEVKGVLIAAEGAADPVVVQKIQQAVMALFQIEAHKIKIIKMK